MNPYSAKRLIIFDLDGTLALSKSAIDEEMRGLLTKLLEEKKVLVMSGGRWNQFEKQLLGHLNLDSAHLASLFISPGSGSSMYRFEGGEIHEMYADILTRDERQSIMDAFDYALPKAGFVPSEHQYGKLIEDRQSQVTFSALGQEAPLAEKETWDPDHAKREKIVAYLREKIPDLEIHMGGTTSIDITKPGEGKDFGIKQASERLGIPVSDMLYIGDALYPGGNDEPAKKSGVDTIQVKDVEETKKVISEIIGL